MSKAASTLLMLSVVAVAWSSCGRREQKVQPTSPSAAQIPQIPTARETGPFVVIGHLEHRDRIVTVKSGGQGPVYSVLSKDGKILFENLTGEQLKSESPEIHDFIEAATAGQASLSPELKPTLMMKTVR